MKRGGYRRRAMEQRSFTDFEYEQKPQRTRREIFLGTMDEVLPWEEWESLIKPHYPKGEKGRPVKGIRVMLKMYLLQMWFSLSDRETEEAIIDSNAMRHFLGIDLIQDGVPDATTLLRFRRLLEEHQIGEKIFQNVKEYLERKGLLMQGGSIIDATIINAPRSTKNEEHKRDEEMSSTRKGNNWHFGMKVHSKVDAGTGYVTEVVGTTAKVSDIAAAHMLLTEDDKVVYGDSGYVGIEKQEEIKASNPDTEFRIVARPKQLKKRYKNYNGFNWEESIERRKSEIRSFVEHPFLYVKRRFSKAIYKGIAKNMQRIYMLFAFANISMCMQSGRGYFAT